MVEPQLGMSFQDIVDWAKYAERQGYGYFFRSDHLLPTQGERNRDSPECWISLGAVAASTKRIKFGPMVSPIGFRNPALLAQMACNLHAYSRGRLLLGAGAGWYQEEYVAKGIEFPAVQVRHQQLLEALQIIRPLTEGKAVSFSGTHYKANTICYPKTKVRLILGGWSRFMRGLVDNFADEWNLWNGTVSDFEEIKEHLKKSDRKIEISRAGFCFVAETRKRLQKKLERKVKLVRELNLPTDVDSLRKNEILCGDVDDFRSQLNQFRKAGVDRFYFDLLDPRDKEMVQLLTKMLK